MFSNIVYSVCTVWAVWILHRKVDRTDSCSSIAQLTCKQVRLLDGCAPSVLVRLAVADVADVADVGTQILGDKR